VLARGEDDGVGIVMEDNDLGSRWKMMSWGGRASWDGGAA
jgi:hypothetical protein